MRVVRATGPWVAREYTGDVGGAGGGGCLPLDNKGALWFGGHGRVC